MRWTPWCSASGGLHLIELKHYQGTITGNAYRWQRGRRSEVSPLLHTRRKAQRLKSVIVDALAGAQPGLGAQARTLQTAIDDLASQAGLAT